MDKKLLRQRLKSARIKYPDVIEFHVTDKELLRLATSPCAHCGATENIQFDHIISLAMGGRTSIGNLQSLCRYCNMSKGGKLMIEFRTGKKVGIERWFK